MTIDIDRNGKTAVLRLDGRLDRDGAEQLSNVLDELLRSGVRSVEVDLTTVSYVSSAGIKVLSRWEKELAVLRGDVHLTGMSPPVRETMTICGWDARADQKASAAARAADLRMSSWKLPAGQAASGHYETSVSAAGGSLRLQMHGDPDAQAELPASIAQRDAVEFPDGTFGLGVGAIGNTYRSCCDRFGELVAAGGCVAYFPTDGARMADYVVGEGSTAPKTVLASGLTCTGEFAKLVRFSTQLEAEAVPLSELAAVCLEASGDKVAGLVIAGEAVGLSGARRRVSPAAGIATPARSGAAAMREWLLFAPERTHSLTTALIVGVVARGPSDPLAQHLRPLGFTGRLYGHFHAAVFSYSPMPLRTVELRTLLRGLFASHDLRDVLHLVWDDRDQSGVAESALVRGVGWVSPITEIS